MKKSIGFRVGVQIMILLFPFLKPGYGLSAFNLTLLTKNYVPVKDSTDLFGKRVADNIKIIGKITTENKIAINNVEVSIYGPEYYKNLNIDKAGNFVFDNLIEDNNYEIYFKKEGDPMEGVSVIDMVYLNRHLSKAKNLTSPYKKVAADIDQSNDLSFNDLKSLRSFILGKTSTEEIKKSWQFIDINHKFETNMVPEMNNFNRLSKDMVSSDFIAVKVGDIDGTISDIYSQEHQKKHYKILEIDLPPTLFYANEIIDIPVYANKSLEISGIQMAMEFDEFTFEVIKLMPGVMEVRDNDYAIFEGDFRLAYAPVEPFNLDIKKPLFYIKVKTKSSGKVSNQLAISYSNLESMAYDGDENPVFIKSNSSKSEVLTVMQNFPNPFIESTNVKFSLEEEMPVEINIFNVAGELLYHKYDYFPKGIQTFTIGDQELSDQTGIFVVNVEIAEVSKSKTILRVK